VRSSVVLDATNSNFDDSILTSNAPKEVNKPVETKFLTSFASNFQEQIKPATDSARERANSYDDQMPQFVSRIEEENNPLILVERNSI
jgi:hypothetical protein